MAGPDGRPASPNHPRHPHIGIGGAELQLAGLAAATPPERAEHRILYYSDAFDYQGFQVYRNSGVPFARVGRGTGGPPVFLFKLAKAIAAGRPHIVHCWLASGALWGRWAATLAGVGHIVVGIRSRHLDLSWLLRASRLADGRRVRYLVNSTAAADAVARLIGPPAGAHGGVDPRVLRPHHARPRLKACHADAREEPASARIRGRIVTW